ncbi:hypothetical protein [Novosphingobium sp.]|uniref:hypothetical protein n=1 Tax=Novosphingobium sp. TaxID=1874826 RepID=UPI001ECA2078|nr:hypothetical protein [Novosphingobium sp.]MBK9009297.1 hypothetical protein [Novosphingobium sp.]
MKKLALLGAAALAALAVPSALQASADMTCYPSWRLDARELGCSGKAALSPGNDTRINLLLLLRDRQGTSARGLTLPKPEWDEFGYGGTFFDWDYLRATFYPRPADAEGGGYGGSRCDSVGNSAPAFEAALAANRALRAEERSVLAAARTRLQQTCSSAENLTPWPDGAIASAAGREFLGYLKAADAFYAARWDEATPGFAALSGASDPWVREAATYMTGRSALNAAQDKAFDDWGGFDGQDKVDKASATAARDGFAAYLKAWPEGRYAASARGLLRRVLWLEGDLKGLSAEYDRLLAAVPAGEDKAAELIQEIDNKLLMTEGVNKASTSPLLLATLDLMALRSWEVDPDSGETVEVKGLLTAGDLASQQAAFAAHPQLYSFLQASQAYYAAGDMKAVLTLLPDDARQKAYGPLSFSRQVLRGMALAALNDPNESGFWRELLGGADPLHQRPLVELGLAMSLERDGKLAEVFAKGSPIGDTNVRSRLLLHSAGPELLRAEAANAARPQRERDIALFTLLYKQLTRGRYAAFVSDAPLVRAGANTDAGLWSISTQEQVPVGLFRAGRVSDGYPCPALVQTARTLSARPLDVKARLCLGEFLRLGGFDDFTTLDVRPDKRDLGGAANEFPGEPLTRAAIYAAIMDDKAAAPGDRAYALYRAVRCYAPSGNNSCGGEAAEQAVRRGWFERLKRDYPGSPWAKKLKVYW